MGIKWSHSPESITKIKSAISNRSAERKLLIAKKISEAKKGMIGPTLGYRWTDEQKARFKEKCKGKRLSPEAIEKMRKTKTGSTLSLETRLKMSGKIPWNYKGERHQTLYKKIRKSPEYNRWRLAVLKKYNYTCNRCHAIFNKNLSKELAAHHKDKLFINILADNNITTIEEAILCQELWDINNGECLCSKCHIVEHKNMYGPIPVNTAGGVQGQ